MKIDADTKIHGLLEAYPFLIDFLPKLSPAFGKLKNPLLRSTVGKVARLGQVASIGNVPLERLLGEIRDEIRRVTGEEVGVEASEVQDLRFTSRQERHEVLKDIIRDLHAGEDMDVLKRRFAELIRDVGPSEISEMEQRLIDEGMPEEEVKRLCDVHVRIFQESLDAMPAPSTPPGHPVHTLMDENRALEHVLDDLEKSLAAADASSNGNEDIRHALLARFDELAPLERHYLRKENQLFPLLEKRGVSGPSKVMWAIHDDIRALVKETRAALDGGRLKKAAFSGHRLAQMIRDMIYKEENILFPMSLETLTPEDWKVVRQGEEDVGYAWIEKPPAWSPAHEDGRQADEPTGTGPAETLALDVGALSARQVNLLLTHLPLDLTFVDADDTVRYYSQGRERIFPRSPAVIGRRVQNCHPPKSLHVVNRILDSFRSGEKDQAEFWIQLGGRFIHIRYVALRGGDGRYEGCLEVTQDVTAIRKLEGQKRILA